jgi:hypothetical protein
VMSRGGSRLLPFLGAMLLVMVGFLGGCWDSGLCPGVRCGVAV